MRPLLVRWAKIWAFCVDIDWEGGFARRAEVQRASARSYPVRLSVFFLVGDVWDTTTDFLADCERGSRSFERGDSSPLLPLEQALLHTYLLSCGVIREADPYWDASVNTHVAACG
jgi:hypothetical protein